MPHEPAQPISGGMVLCAPFKHSSYGTFLQEVLRKGFLNQTIVATPDTQSINLYWAL